MLTIHVTGGERVAKRDFTYLRPGRLLEAIHQVLVGLGTFGKNLTSAFSSSLQVSLLVVL